MDISQPGGHLDQLIRQTRAHHTQLSSMADVKANMLLTMSSLVITFSLRYLEDPYLRWPVIVLTIFCLITVFNAAYAVMPKVNFEFRPNLKKLDFNILFFGSFMNLSYDEFEGAMEEVLSEPAKVYEAQIREIYELGVFLGRNKYLYIRRAYVSFLSGLAAGVLTLLVVEAFNWFGA
jgi:hypothetical protein